MKNIFKIYKSDIKKVFSNYAALIVIIALSILPSLYAWFNIKASWDPYGQEATSQIKIGVVNNDSGYEFNDKQVNIGEKIIDQLKENDVMGWQFVSEEEAVKAIEDGDYYAMITIPQEFSADIFSLMSNNVTKGKIIYTVNEKINAIAPKITSKGATAVQEKINTTVIETVSDIVLSTAKDFGIEVKEQLPKLTTIYDKLVEIQAKFSEVYATLDTSYEGVTKIEDLLEDLQSDMPKIEEMLSNAETLGNSVGEFLNTSKTELNNIAPTIKEDIRLLNDISTDLLSYVDTIIKAINSGSEKAPELIDNMSTKINSLNSLSESLLKILTTLNNMSLNKPLTEIINNLQGVKGTLQQVNDSLIAIKEQIQNGVTPDLTVLSNAKILLGDVSSISANLYTTFDSNILAAINNIIEEAHETSVSAVAVIKGAQEKLPTVKEIITDISAVAKKGTEGIDYAKENLPKAENVLNEIISKTYELNNDENLKDLLNLIQTNVEERANYLSAPVELEENTLYPMGNYGTAMTPFYSVLSLWVGMTLLVSMLSVQAHGEYKPVEVYFGKLLLFLTIGIVQSLIVALGDLYLLKIYCTNPLLFVSGIVFTSVTFVFIVYSLVSVFGNVGKVVSIILLVLQVAGSGGTFPIQLTPKFFQNINPFLPFTYAISFAREAIGGVVTSVLAKDIIIMLIYITVSILISVFLKKPINKLMNGFAVKYKESGIGE